MEESGNIPIFNISGIFFGNISRNLLGIFAEYTGNISWECPTNIPLASVAFIKTKVT